MLTMRASGRRLPFPATPILRARRGRYETAGAGDGAIDEGRVNSLTDAWILFGTVLVFSTVQSVVGVGLLVFGTPTLLLAGYAFDHTLACLLPASAAISLMQVVSGHRHVGRLGVDILVYSAPAIVIGLALVLLGTLAVDVRLLVAVALLASGVARLWEPAQRALGRVLAAHVRPCLVLTGLVHGVSNMGGGFLTILVTALTDDKERMRARIAFGYLLFAASQLAVLAWLSPQVFGVETPWLAATAAITYLTVGSRIYRWTSRPAYQRIVTAFMLAYGGVLIGQQLARGFTS
jgi:uncharacterized membrane protein YfcA